MGEQQQQNNYLKTKTQTAPRRENQAPLSVVVDSNQDTGLRKHATGDRRRLVVHQSRDNTSPSSPPPPCRGTLHLLKVHPMDPLRDKSGKIKHVR